MSKKPPVICTCRTCGKTWTNTGLRGGGRWVYCSNECAEKARISKNVNKRKLPDSGKIPVGLRFLRDHDGEWCVVCADAGGLPYAESVRELAIDTTVTLVV